MSVAAKHPLRDLQQWMMTTISTEGGSRAGIEASAKDNHSLAGEKAHTIVRRSKNLTSLERIDIYAGMYFLRMLECMEQDYTIVRRTVGPEKFQELVNAYTNAHPSRHYSFNMFGEKFPAFLRRSRKLVENNVFLSEVAAIERSVEESFDAVCDETLKPRALKAIPPEQWSEMRVRLASTVHLHAFKYPVNDYMQAVRDGMSPQIPAPKKTWLAVYRKNYDVWRKDLTGCQYDILSGLARGEKFQDAIINAIEKSESDPEEVAKSIGAWFKNWTASSLFARVD